MKTRSRPQPLQCVGYFLLAALAYYASKIPLMASAERKWGWHSGFWASAVYWGLELLWFGGPAVFLLCQLKKGRFEGWSRRQALVRLPLRTALSSLFFSLIVSAALWYLPLWFMPRPGGFHPFFSGSGNFGILILPLFSLAAFVGSLVAGIVSAWVGFKHSLHPGKVSGNSSKSRL